MAFRANKLRILDDAKMTTKVKRLCSLKSEVLGFPDGPRILARNTCGREESLSTTDTFKCGRKSVREVQIENKVYGALNYTFRSYLILK